MGKIRGFLEYERVEESTRAPKERIKDYREFTLSIPKDELEKQGARCMNCGIPFCHSGCPLGNLIPDFNDAVYKKNWKEASQILHSTNNFPEFTGRLCPAPCESACVLGLIDPPVSIELIEKNIVEEAFSKGWITPQLPTLHTGRKIAIVGSGPTGLAAAQQLNRAGHTVTVFERDVNIGGLLRYGIPDFKLSKDIIDRRLNIMEAEGVIFKPNTHVGSDFSIDKLKTFDVILLAGGATNRRGLPVEGSDLKGVIQAMDFLKHQNKLIENVAKETKDLSAKDKHIIVIGGGDTGSDCIGVSNRQGAASVTNFEIMNKPPEYRTSENPWPYWPFTLKTTSSHKEGVSREFAVMTKKIIGDEKGHAKALQTVDVEWKKRGNERPELVEIKNSEREWPCDLILLALGFTGPEANLGQQLGLNFDERSNIKGHNYQTNIPNIFVAGDMRRGQSLIVWAISEGREAAYHIDTYLMRHSSLHHKEKGDLPSVN